MTDAVTVLALVVLTGAVAGVLWWMERDRNRRS